MSVIQKILISPDDSELIQQEKSLHSRRQIPPFFPIDPLLIFHCDYEYTTYRENDIKKYSIHFDFTQKLMNIYTFIQKTAYTKQGPKINNSTIPFEYKHDYYYLFITFTYGRDTFEYALSKSKRTNLSFQNLVLVFKKEESIFNDHHFWIYFSKFHKYDVHFSFQ